MLNKKQEVDTLVKKWDKILEGIERDYDKRVVAVLLENQAKNFVKEMAINEDISPGTTTTGKIGTFQKFAFPLVRRVYPELRSRNVVGVQPINAPVSQIFYLGNSRQSGSTDQVVYSKYKLTYRGLVNERIGTTDDGVSGTGQFLAAVGADGLSIGEATGGFDTSFVLQTSAGAPLTTVGGQIAAWPNNVVGGWSISAGERLTGTGIPEINFHIQQQPVVAKTRKMRALWTIEAGQDLKAYHDLDLERELTDLLSNEIQLEIDREVLEDLRMIAYHRVLNNTAFGGWYGAGLDMTQNSNNFGETGAGQSDSSFIPSAFTYDFTSNLTGEGMGTSSNVFVIDFAATGPGFAPQHVGHVYANLLAVINIASQDIYRTTWKGPGTVLVTSPLVAALLESAAKLEGGVSREDGPSNIGNTQIEYRGKFAGKYDLLVDPLWPEDEILVAYKGSGPMDAGYVYAPYIPIQSLPTITDPESFQPRKGIMSRYAKAAIQPASRHYRIVRIIGAAESFLFPPFARNTGSFGTAAGW